MQRREFLQSALGASLLLAGGPIRAAEPDSLIEVLTGELIGEISPNIYGHFAEHIGGVVYDGIWVGRDSKIPNMGGVRTALIDDLQRIKAPVIRWPGGCFADSYDWKDGVGPAAQRPKRTNFWETDPDAKRLHGQEPQLFDPNSFGTNEFVQFCEACNAQPYLAANLRSLPALDFDHWVEYCNSPAGSTTYALAREAAGRREPFHVRFWGVGNESWGCGGNFQPEDYASEFRRFTDWVPAFGEDLEFIAAGPNNNDVDWTQRFFEQIFAGKHPYKNPHLRGWSVHHYSRVPDGDALQFGVKEWFALLRSGNEMEQILLDNWAVMGQYDRAHHIKFVVDEYGSWHRSGTEIHPSHIFGQQITIRDALLTASTLDCFNRHAEKVSMANCAQLVNNLNALFLAHEDRFWRTPNYHVFAMYADHQGGQSIRTEIAAPSLSPSVTGLPDSFRGLQGSASIRGKVLTLTAVNPSTTEARDTTVNVRGATVRSGKATVLHASDIHAHNTFEQTDAVKPQEGNVQVNGTLLRCTIPPASVSRLHIELA